MNQFGGEQFHQHILDSLRCAVIASDSSGTIIFWNRYATSLFGWDAAEMLGKSIRAILPDDETGNEQFDMLLGLSNDGSSAGELQLQCNSGDVFAANVTTSPISPVGDNPAGTAYVIISRHDYADDETAATTAGADEFPGGLEDDAVGEVSRDIADSGSSGALLLRRVLDTLPIGVSIAAKDGQIVLSNPAEQRIWGGSVPPQPGAEDEPLIALEDEALARAIENGDVVLNEIVEIERPGGGRKTLLSSAAPIRNQRGQIIGGIAVHQDITEQRRVEEAERKHRTFVNALNNITAILTSSLNLQTVMERILDSVGRVVPHEAANIMLIEDKAVRVAFWRNYGPRCDEMFRVNHYPLDMPMLANMLNTELPYLVSDTDGAPEWIRFDETAWIRSSVGVPIRAHDVILGFLILDSSEPDFFQPPDAERLRAFAYQAAIAIENARLFSRVQEHAAELETRVTERTAELNAAKNHVEAILEHSSDGFALVNEAGVISQVNPSFGQLFGVRELEPDSRKFQELVHADARDRLQSAFHDALVQEKASRLEVACYRADGSMFDADIAIAPLFDATQKSYFYILNVRDITRHKTAERELRTALEREKQLSDLKSRFVAIVSHEFRTPLATIQTSSDLLYRYSDRLTLERRNEIILRIQSQIQRLIALLEDILTIANADSFGLMLDIDTVDLIKFCGGVIRFMGNSLAQTHSILFQYSPNSLSVELDPKLIKQALVSLLSNAIQYSYDGSPVDLIISATDADAIIEVRNQGAGIREENLPGLFDPFYRAHNGEEGSGTGLGLAVVKRVIEAHHGTVAVESKQGVSTRFIITIPKHQPPPEPSD